MRGGGEAGGSAVLCRVRAARCLEGRLGRLAHPAVLPVREGDLRVVAQDARLHELRRALAASRRLLEADDAALRRVRDAVDGVLAQRVVGLRRLLLRHDERDDGHLVGGEGARLVGADDGGAAKRLDGGQLADDDVAVGHATGAEREAERDHRGEPLGDGRHAERDRNLCGGGGEGAAVGGARCRASSRLDLEAMP